MPNNLMMADVNFPDLSGKSQKEQISTITNYLFMLLEQLRYVLNNLGISNFNESELDGMQKQFTGPIQIQVTDMKGNISTLYQDVGEIVNQVEDVEGNYSSLQIQVSGISSTVSNLNGQFSQVKQDVDGLQVYTQGGVTYISGSHVKSGTIEGSVLKCSLNSSQGASDGEMRFYYNNKMVGRIQMDTYGNSDGSGDESRYRVFFEAMGSFALKLISDTNLSVTSKNANVYIGADGGRVEISGQNAARIRSPNKLAYEFRDDGIYYNNTKIVST